MISVNHTLRIVLARAQFVLLLPTYVSSLHEMGAWLEGRARLDLMVYTKQSTTIMYSQWVSFSNTTMHPVYKAECLRLLH